MKAVNTAVNKVVPESYEDPFYHVLLAEMYLQLENNSLAADQYLLAAKTSHDIKLLKQATILAATTGKNRPALDVAKRWVKQNPDSLEARQYKALLLLRNDQYADSARVLQDIKQYVERDSKNPAESEQFVSRLLSLETHVLQAYKAYRVYLNKFGETASSENKALNSGLFNRFEHQQMTLAALAMKNSRYKVVDRVLKDFHSEQAVLLRSKALNKLGRTTQAAAILKPFISKKKTSDSLRFEYVRFLIISGMHEDKGQKKEAASILRKLVKKHPDNKDLTKALVALYLEMKKWTEAESYAQQLLRFKAYQGDAYYFLGEVRQARGENVKALQSYLKVSSGDLLDKAQEKIPVLLKQQQGMAAARLWLHQQRLALSGVANEKKPKKNQKAKFYKLEGDLLISDNNIDSAMDFYQRALSLSPENQSIRYSRALAYERQGRIRQAENDLIKIVKRDKNNSLALNALGYLLVVHTNRLDEASQLINRAHQLSPDNAAINDSLGWLHYRRGDMEDAERYLRKSFQLMKQPQVASHLIEVLQKSGQTQEANLILEQMLQQYPDSHYLKRISSQGVSYN